jgi:MarR family transcriptional regulator, lower aerobic nicotinate degradation pathway regulator
MMNYALLQQLITECSQYEQANGQQADMPQFARWLANKYDPLENVNIASTAVEGESTEVVIGRIVFFLTRYAKIYAKKALEGSVLSSIDEFVYLAALLHYQKGLSKSELIRYNRHEKPTGMEIIRRLIALGLVAQAPSEMDKRSTVLAITEAGKAVVFPLFDKMAVVSKVIVGDLGTKEQLQLVALLEQLEHFHQGLLGNLKGDWGLADLGK